MHGLVPAAEETRRNEEARNLRSAQRRSGFAVERLGLLVHRESQVAQPIDDPRAATHSRLALAPESGFERIVLGIHAQTQDVELALPQVFDARGDAIDLDRGKKVCLLYTSP